MEGAREEWLEGRAWREEERAHLFGGSCLLWGGFCLDHGGMPLFDHAGRKKLTPPPLSAPLKLIKGFLRLEKRPCAHKYHHTTGALLVWVSLWTILNRPTQSRTDAASSAMDDATRAIEIERTMTTQFENTELSGELHTA